MASTTILIVEDENIVAKDIANRLRNLGYDVCGSVPTGEDALQATRQHHPDLVLMDIMLKGDMDGIEAASRILSRYNVPVIFLTAYADDRTLQRAKITEAFGYLLKPFEERELHITIEMALYKHRMEGRLRESERRYKALFDKAPDAIIMFDPEAAPHGRFLAANESAAAMHGYTLDAFMKLSLADILAPGVLEKNSGFKNRKEEGEWITEEVMHRKKDGTEFSVEISTGLIELEGKKIVLGFDRDITDRKKLEDQLRQAQKMESIGTLASGVAHDFNNVLNNVLGFAMQLKKFANDEVKVRRYAETIEKSATRGAELSAQLLSFARSNRRGGKRITLPDVIGEVVLGCREIFPPGIVLTQSIDPELLPVLGDHGELYQVLQNLCANARDAIISTGRNGGTIAIEARNEKAGVELSPQLFAARNSPLVVMKVSDDGTGIPPSVREKIFDPFFTTKERGQGTGLGLSIVYNIVRGHRGTIHVDTELGQGTTFSVYLPTAADQPAVAPKPEEVPKKAGAGRAVLLVDDEPAMQELGKELLEDENFRVIIAKNGTEALSIYREHNRTIDLVILDLVMPGIDGGQAYAEMKKMNPALRAFFCTGFVSDKLIAGLLAEEHLRAIAKPFRPEEFVGLVYELLADREATP